MAGFFFSQDEQDLLKGLPGLVQRLYVFQLRPRMNMYTRMVGEPPHGINWAMLARLLGIDPRPGIKGEDFSVESVRRAAKHLESIGLVVVRSKPRCLLFELPRALVYNEADRLSADKPDSLYVVKADIFKTSQDADLSSLFDYLDGNADILIDVKPDSLELIKPDRVTCIGRKPDSLKQQKANSSKLLESPRKSRLEEGATQQNPTDKNTGKPTTIINTLPNLTSPKHGIECAIQGNPCLFWRKFFKEQGFDGKRLSTTDLVVMYEDWAARGITTEVVERCIEIAIARLGSMPDTPIYLKPIVDEYILKKNDRDTEIALHGYTAPVDSLGGYLIDDRFLVLAPSPDEAVKFTSQYKQISGEPSVSEVSGERLVYVDEHLGEMSVNQIIAHAVRSQMQIPLFVRSMDG